MANPDSNPGKIKGRGAKARKTRVIKRETYSKRDFKGFKSGEEIFDAITKLIEEDMIEPGKREGIYCTVYKHLQSYARTSMVHDMTPDLDGAVNLGTKELLAVLLSISRRDVDKLIRNSTQELKVDVFVELSEGESCLTRFPVRYYTTAEDLISYVLKDRGFTDSVLDYQLAVVKTPFKGKSKIKSIMCAVGANNQHSLAGKDTRPLYPHQYPIQELGESPKVEYSSTDGVPRVTSCYLYVSPREAQSLTVYFRREDGEVEEETLSLRPSATTAEIIEEAISHLGLGNDPLAYKLIMKAYAFDEKSIALEEQPLILIDSTEDCQEGYPQIWIEDQDMEVVPRTSTLLRKHSSRKGSRKKSRQLSADPDVLKEAAPQSNENEKSPGIDDSEDPNSNSEISKIQNHLYHESLRRKTQSTKNVGQIKEQETHLKSILLEQEKVISALSTAVTTAESISPQNSVKDVSQTKLKEALAEKQTQIWELEENRNKDKENLLSLAKSNRALDTKFKDLDEKFKQHKLNAKRELEMEKREKRELEKELERERASDEVNDLRQDSYIANQVNELKLQVDKDQEIIDMTTSRNSELKDEIMQLKAALDTNSVNENSNVIEIDGLKKSGITDSISINDFNEWSKNLEDLKKRNDQLLFRNKQLCSENAKLNEAVDHSTTSYKQVEELKLDSQNLKDANEELTISLEAKDAVIAGLTERINGSQDNDGSFDEFQEKYYDLYEKNQRLESVMSGTVEKLRSKLNVLEDEKVQLQNTINGLNTNLDSKKRQLKEFDYMKNRVEMMEMEHSHLKEFSAQLIEENKGLDDMNKAIDEKDQQLVDLAAELADFRGLEKVNCAIQIDDPRIEDLESKLEEALEKVDSRSAVILNLNGKVALREDENHNLKGMASDFESTNELLTAEIERLKKQNSSLESKGTQKSEEIASFKMIIDALNEQTADAKNLCDNEMCSSSTRLKDIHLKKETELIELLNDSKIDVNKQMSITSELMTLQTKFDELQDEFSILEADKADADETVESQDKSLKEKEEQITDLLSLTSSLRDEVDRGNEKNTTITAKRDELSKELTDARLQKADIELEINQVQDELNTFKRRAKQAKEQSESLQNLNDALTAQLHEFQSNDCSQGKCPASVELMKDLDVKEQEKTELQSKISDLSNQRSDLQNVVIKSKNDLCENQIEYQEMESSYIEAREEAESFKAQLRSLQRKLDPKKRNNHIDNLENQVEMYHAEVASLKSVTRNLEDEVERMSLAEVDSTDIVQELQEKNSSVDRQLGDAKGEIYDLEEQLEKFKQSLRESQKESATVDMYLTERQMLKDTINKLEEEMVGLRKESDEAKASLTAVKEELSIVKGVRDIQTRDTASNMQNSLKLKKVNDNYVEELSCIKENLQKKTDECSRQVQIIERHKSRTRELELEVRDIKSQLHVLDGSLNNSIESQSLKNGDDPKQQKLEDLNSTISDLSATVKCLTYENKEMETSISEMNEEEQIRQNKIARLEAHFQQEVELLHDEYKSKICGQMDEIKKWINQNKVLSEEILMLEQEKEDLERVSTRRRSDRPEQADMQNALHEVTSKLDLQSRMTHDSMAQFEDARMQIENMDAEILTYKKKCMTAEKHVDDISRRVQEKDRSIDEYKQRLEDLKTADENKRTEIRLLNKMTKEYSDKIEESEHDYAELKSKYTDKQNLLDELQKEIVSLRSQRDEYENVIVALESANASDTVDNSAKSRRINELQALLSEAESVAHQKSSDLEKTRVETAHLQEENDQLLEEIKSYQDEWRKLTSLLGNVNHTNHANMDSCKRLENKLDDIEFKVTETNVHVDICQSDMFSKTEALVRENSLLEQKISEKSQSLDQSEKFLRESHENINLLQTTMSDLQEKIDQLQGTKATDTSYSNQDYHSTAELEEKINTLTTQLNENEEFLLEARSERASDESAFKVSLDTIVRSYEDKLGDLVKESELKDEELSRLQTELKSVAIR